MDLCGEQHPAKLAPGALLEQCRVRFTRRSGPGGQNRNKVETAVLLEHIPTGMVAQASERRSQLQNRAVALFRLRLELALLIRAPVGATEPTDLWKTRCLEGKISINPNHEDFPSLLAEAIDVLHQANYDFVSAASNLECTPSQLLKLVKLEPKALLLVNQERSKRLLRPLH